MVIIGVFMYIVFVYVYYMLVKMMFLTSIVSLFGTLWSLF